MTALLWSAYAFSASRIIEVDLGRVSPKLSARHTLRVSEEIKSVVSLCECVQARVYKNEEDAASEPQNADGVPNLVDIEFNPSGYSGAVQEEIVLMDKEENIIRVQIKAFVLSE